MDNNQQRTDLHSLTADVVASYVSNNKVDPLEVGGIVVSVYTALSSLRNGVTSEAASAQALEPAVPIKKSVRSDAVICLECGASMKMLRRHLEATHDLSPQDYRARWNLPPSYPLTAPSYTEKRAAMARDMGLGARTRSSKNS